MVRVLREVELKEGETRLLYNKTEVVEPGTLAEVVLEYVRGREVYVSEMGGEVIVREKLYVPSDDAYGPHDEITWMSFRAVEVE